MTLKYKQLQAVLKTYRDRGMTLIKLNSKLELLQAEYNRLQALELKAATANKVDAEVEKSEAIETAIAISADIPVLKANFRHQAALRNVNNATAMLNQSPRLQAVSTANLYGKNKVQKGIETVKNTVKNVVNSYTSNLTDTERQAIRNGIVATKNVRAFIGGFNDGLKRSYRD